jgi:hypothetical protein
MTSESLEQLVQLNAASAKSQPKDHRGRFASNAAVGAKVDSVMSDQYKGLSDDSLKNLGARSAPQVAQGISRELDRRQAEREASTATHSTALDAIKNGAGKDGSHAGPLYSLHAGTYNPTTGTGSGAQFFQKGNSLLIIAHSDGSHVKAISSAGEQYTKPGAYIGRRATQVKQGSNSDKRQDVRIVGYVSSNGTHYGHVPDKHVPFFVFK